MTKKQNKRETVRRTRRVLNNGADVGPKISGHRLHKHHYGAGLTRSDERLNVLPLQDRDDPA